MRIGSCDGVPERHKNLVRGGVHAQALAACISFPARLFALLRDLSSSRNQNCACANYECLSASAARQLFDILEERLGTQL